DAQLTNGADVTAAIQPGGQLAPADAQRLATVPGARHVATMQHRFAYVGSDLQDLFGIDPAALRQVTTLRDAYFSGGTADTLMQRLTARPDGILVSEETVKDYQLSSGDLIRLRLQDSRTHQLRTVPFHFVGVAKEFPTAPLDSFFVANAAYVARATGSDAVGTVLVDTGGTGQPATAARLRSRFADQATVTDITRTRGAVGSSLTSVDLSGLTRIELAFAVLLSIASGGLVLALGLAERRRAHAVLRVLGGSNRQVRGTVLSEGALLTGVGLTLGAGLGAAVSVMLVRVLTGVFDPPPDALSVPWAYLAVTALATIGAMGGAVAIASATGRRPAVERLREG
ncbi:MAG: ABC transporter permease, partial [Actinomycetota bacterium]|nr:ABC transporter permease [Actinomycetota bacterium]